MVSARSLLLCVCLALAGAQPTTSNRQRELGIQDLPACGVSCLAVSLPGHCEADDTACLCESRELAEQVSQCMQANCTVAEGLTVAKVQASLCRYPHPSKAKEGTAVLSVLFAIAAVAVVLRLVARVMAREFFIEDYFVTVALILTILMLVPLLLSFEHGFSTHLYDLPDANSLKSSILSLYIAENLYIISLTLIKVSILSFYLRLFKLFRAFRIAVILSLVITVLSSTIILILTILSCRPVERFWDRDIKQGSCLSTTKLAYANSGLAIIQDVVIITLPALLVAGLAGMSRRNKTYVAAMFAVGGFGCVATVLRLSTLEGFGDSADPTWDYVPLTYWTSIELVAGFVVSSMPAVRTLCLTLARRYGTGWTGPGPLRAERSDGAPPAWSPPRGSLNNGGWPAQMSQAVSAAGRSVGGSLGSAVGRVVRPAARAHARRYRQIQWDSWGAGAGGVTYPADVYCHPAFEDAAEDSDAAQQAAAAADAPPSFKMRPRPRSYVGYHLPRSHSRRGAA